MSQKLWGGRFEKETDRRVEDYTSSLAIDARLWRVDILASQAHVRMLGHTGILPQDEATKIEKGLAVVLAKIESGGVTFNPAAEDIHSEIERLLNAEVGAASGRLHTARSRNDQVATDTRLYLRGEIDRLADSIRSMQSWITDMSAKNLDTILPGLTHTQHGQPVSLAHHLMAYFWMFKRDVERLTEIRKRVNQLPLGSAALAGTGFPIDRQMVARDLAFDGLCENSLDAVSDRDFLVEFLSASSLIMMHLSRLSEELIYWSTPEFAFIALDDSVTTGSSIMPQKKNPDVAELIRGRVGRVYGQLMAALTMLKALPLAYNRDLQEDKVQLFDALDTVVSSVEMMNLMLTTAAFKADRMAAALAGDFSNATDLADDLVRKGLPFREAHEVIGRIVRHCLEKNIAMENLKLGDLKQFSHKFDDGSLLVLPHRAVMAARKSEGGTAPKSVIEQIEKARAWMKSI